MDYFITRGDKIHGPTPEREVRTYLAYGSVKADDLLRRADEEEWFPAKLFPEFASAIPDAPTKKTNKWFPMGQQKSAHRTMRFRDLKHVPEEQRAGRVIWQLISGFLWRPLTFWRTASTVLSTKIYRGAKDEQGYLRTWPQWSETPVMIVVLLHAILWTGAAFWFIPRAKQVVVAVKAHATDAWHETIALQQQPLSVKPRVEGHEVAGE